MKQIAELANVSLQSVSRVVNKQPGVSAETRAHVNRIIEELGYRPNRVAQAMRGSSYTLGVVGFGLQHYGPSHTLMGVEYEATDQNYRIILKLIRDPKDYDFDAIVEDLLADHVDGIIWAVPQIGPEAEAVFARARDVAIPLAFTDAVTEAAPLVVRADNYRGGVMVTRHLVDQGHAKIGIITGPLEYASAVERLRAWRDVVTQAGLDQDESLVCIGDWSARSGFEGFHKLYKLNPGMTAVVASNDYMALGVLHAATDRGLHVPSELAVVGYDDLPEAEFFQPSLTSVRQNLEELGRRAVRELIAAIETHRIEGKFEPNQVLIVPQLVVRSSSISPQRQNRRPPTPSR
ncbi:MAG: LacI family DNA-binding transcriptional regulator [Anaerolineae bacterium]